jgi:hypothetical protein
MRIGRNEQCPCGSGRKLKNCCGERAMKKKGPSGLMLLFGAILLIAAIGLVPPIWRSRTTAAPTLPASPVQASTVPAPQPDGPAPPGKVWSVEHGHWHDEAPAASPFVIDGLPVAGSPSAAGAPISATVNTPLAPQPAPDGPAPPGKVWSAEHGHWHDVP